MPFQEEPEAYGAAVLRFLRADTTTLEQERAVYRARFPLNPETARR